MRRYLVSKGCEDCQDLLAAMFFFFFFKQEAAYEVSAFLVGSEMCIKGRYSFPLSLPCYIQFRLVFHSCSLYTSDAADDLPCVDLGGRRTIKKKNTPDSGAMPTRSINYPKPPVLT